MTTTEKPASEQLAELQLKKERQKVVLTWVILIPILLFIALIVYLSITGAS